MLEMEEEGNFAVELSRGISWKGIFSVELRGDYGRVTLVRNHRPHVSLDRRDTPVPAPVVDIALVEQDRE